VSLQTNSVVALKARFLSLFFFRPIFFPLPQQAKLLAITYRMTVTYMLEQYVYREKRLNLF